MVETGRRTYRSPLREEQARVTRRAIVETARELFIEVGYAATTIDAVADRAGVSRKTVFTSVGGKAVLLKLACDWALAGDDEPVPIDERPAAQQMLAETDPARLLSRWARLPVRGRRAAVRHPRRAGRGRRRRPGREGTRRGVRAQPDGRRGGLRRRSSRSSAACGPAWTRSGRPRSPPRSWTRCRTAASSATPAGRWTSYAAWIEGILRASVLDPSLDPSRELAED